MRVLPEENRITEIIKLLTELLDVDKSEVTHVIEPSGERIDAILNAGSWKFVIEWKNSSRVSNVRNAIDSVQEYARESGDKVVPLVAVPFMGEIGRRLCLDSNTAWIDLSGNARIFAPSLKILIDGKPNKFKRIGRPSSIFSPQSSRIVRWLLMHPYENFSQRDLSLLTNVDEGYTSRIINKMLEDEYVNKNESGMVQLSDPDLLFDSWYEAYDFDKHRIIKGNIAARTGDILIRMISEKLDKDSIEYSATGLCAAWLYCRFAGFRIVTIYLREEPSEELYDKLMFRENPRGANTWFVIPNDAGVFQESMIKDKIKCAHPVQVYLDLKGHPERSKEAAEKLKEEYLRWDDYAR